MDAALENLRRQIRQLRGSVEDLPRRSELCRQALKRVSQEAQPELWAGLHFELGLCLQQMRVGEVAQNLQEACHHLTQALQVFTLATHPKEWAATYHNLGSLYRTRARGCGADDQERAIECYAEALKVFKRERFPQEWADVTFNLANVYLQRLEGSLRENLDRAIRLYNAVLEVYSREAQPLMWAEVHCNLGTACKNYLWGDHAAHVDDALDHYQQALSKLERHAYPRSWARAQHGLGSAWLRRVRGNHDENLSQAITALNEALRVRTREACPAAWAETMHNLAVAYLERQTGDRARQIERAIEWLQAVRQVRERDDLALKVERGMTLSVLANAYSWRIRGDRAENLERALRYYEAARDLQSQVGPPHEWATTQLNMAVALRERVRGCPGENLERAITCYHQALTVFTSQAFPLRWATTQTNLADLYWRLGQQETLDGTHADCFEKGIAYCRAAREVYTRAKFPAKWALVQYNLGNLYADRIAGDRDENLAAAIVYYQAALAERPERDFPFERAQTLNNLATIFMARAGGTRGPDLERAIRHFEQALAIYRRLGVRQEERRSAANLAGLYYDLGDWHRAYETLRDLLALLERMRADALGDLGTRDIARQNTRFYNLMLDVCLRLGAAYHAEAFTTVEANKARAFLAQLGYAGVPTPPVSAPFEPLLAQERELVQELRGYEAAIRNAAHQDERHSARIARTAIEGQDHSRTRLNDIWRQLETEVPEYVAIRRGDPVRYAQLAARLARFQLSCALVEYYTLLDEMVVFIARAGQQGGPRVVRVPLPHDQLGAQVQAWRGSIDAGAPGYAQRQRWRELATSWLAEVLPHLEGAELVYLVPHGMLHYLPLHALPVNGACLIDRYPVVYAPSAAVLTRVLQRAARPRTLPRAPLVVGAPQGDLPYARREAQAVARFFGVRPYLGTRATKGEIQSQLADARLIHLACHGRFDQSDPLASGVVLAGGKVLTAREIMGMRLQARLVTLSACESGVSEVSQGDELVGLVRALLYAGASSVLVSLWNVQDASTGALMVDFYRRLYDDAGQEPAIKAVAWQQALQETRQSSPDPRHWAPFILVGDWR